MKKTYIAPETQEHKINVESLLDVTSTYDTQAGTGSEDAPVNFSREGGLVWELEEINDEN